MNFDLNLDAGLSTFTSSTRRLRAVCQKQEKLLEHLLSTPFLVRLISAADGDIHDFWQSLTQEIIHLDEERKELQPESVSLFPLYRGAVFTSAREIAKIIYEILTIEHREIKKQFPEKGVPLFMRKGDFSFFHRFDEKFLFNMDWIEQAFGLSRYRLSSIGSAPSIETMNRVGLLCRDRFAPFSNDDRISACQAINLAANLLHSGLVSKNNPLGFNCKTLFARYPKETFPKSLYIRRESMEEVNVRVSRNADSCWQVSFTDKGFSDLDYPLIGALAGFEKGFTGPNLHVALSEAQAVGIRNGWWDQGLIASFLKAVSTTPDVEEFSETQPLLDAFSVFSEDLRHSHIRSREDLHDCLLETLSDMQKQGMRETLEHLSHSVEMCTQAFENMDENEDEPEYSPAPE